MKPFINQLNILKASLSGEIGFILAVEIEKTGKCYFLSIKVIFKLTGY